MSNSGFISNPLHVCFWNIAVLFENDGPVIVSCFVSCVCTVHPVRISVVIISIISFFISLCVLRFVGMVFLFCVCRILL